MPVKIAIKRQTIEQAMENAGIDLDMLRTNYKFEDLDGWIGIVVDSHSELALFLVELTGMLVADTIEDLARRLSSDTMGHSLIAYWPGVELEG